MPEEQDDSAGKQKYAAFQEFTDSLGAKWCFTGTDAPVQAEGTIDGKPFYFRSRWDRWTFGVASNRQPDPVLVDSSEDGFFRSAKYREYRFSASFMPLEVAKRIIDDCIEEYRRWESATT